MLTRPNKSLAGELPPWPGFYRKVSVLCFDGLRAHLRQLLVSLVALPGLLLRLIEERVGEVREALLQGRVTLTEPVMVEKLGKNVVLDLNGYKIEGDFDPIWMFE